MEAPNSHSRMEEGREVLYSVSQEEAVLRVEVKNEAPGYAYAVTVVVIGEAAVIDPPPHVAVSTTPGRNVASFTVQNNATQLISFETTDAEVSCRITACHPRHNAHLKSASDLASDGGFFDKPFFDTSRTLLPDCSFLRLSEVATTTTTSLKPLPLHGCTPNSSEALHSLYYELSRHPHLLEHLISTSAFSTSIKVKLCVDGIWTVILIDDSVPYIPGENGGFFYSYSSVEGCVWVSLLEKAAAKALGGYNALFEMDFADLAAVFTGKPTLTETVPVERRKLLEDLKTSVEEGNLVALTTPKEDMSDHRLGYDSSGSSEFSAQLQEIGLHFGQIFVLKEMVEASPTEVFVVLFSPRPMEFHGLNSAKYQMLSEEEKARLEPFQDNYHIVVSYSELVSLFALIRTVCTAGLAEMCSLVKRKEDIRQVSMKGNFTSCIPETNVVTKLMVATKGLLLWVADPSADITVTLRRPGVGSLAGDACFCGGVFAVQSVGGEVNVCSSRFAVLSHEKNPALPCADPAGTEEERAPKHSAETLCVKGHDGVGPLVVFPFVASSLRNDVAEVVVEVHSGQAFTEVKTFDVEADHIERCVLDEMRSGHDAHGTSRKVSDTLTLHSWHAGMMCYIAYRNTSSNTSYSVSVDMKGSGYSDASGRQTADALARPNSSGLISAFYGRSATSTAAPLFEASYTEVDADSPEESPPSLGETFYAEAVLAAAVPAQIVQEDVKVQINLDTVSLRHAEKGVEMRAPEEKVEKEKEKESCVEAATSGEVTDAGTDDDSATMRALRDLEDEAARMRVDSRPAEIERNARSPTEPTPLRGSGAQTAPLPDSHRPGALPGLKGVFARLASTPQPVTKRPCSPRIKPRKLTRLQQLHSVERMFKDSVERKERELVRLENQVYGESTVKQVLTNEEMTLFTEKLYSQACQARDEKRRALETRYLTELLPKKVLLRERQSVMVKKLYDTVHIDREHSRALHVKHNPPRNRKIRNELDWGETVGRLCARK